MSVCDPDEGMHGLFKGYLPQQIIADVPRTKEQQAEFVRLLRAHRGEVAAVIIEPLVQGAGGMKFYEPEVLRFLRQACDEADCLLILDEIMTGFGRIGPMFACTEAEIVPDIITLSKALTGGTLPLAATVATQACVRGVPVGRSEQGADARADLHGQRPRLRGGQCVARSVRARAAPAIKCGRSRRSCARSWRPAGT